MVEHNNIKIYLAFDIGHKWVGVAIGNNVSYIARELKVLPYDEKLIENVNLLIKEYRPYALVVGIARSKSNLNRPARRVLKFVKEFENSIKCILVDENYSTVFAKKESKQKLLRYDALAARYFLQVWLNQQSPD